MQSIFTAKSPVNFAYTPQIQLLYCDRRTLEKWTGMNVQAPFWRLYWNDRPGAFLEASPTIMRPESRLKGDHVTDMTDHLMSRTLSVAESPKKIRYSIEPSHFTLVAPNTVLSAGITRTVEHFHTHFTVGLPFALVHFHVHQFPAQPWLVKIMRQHYMPRNTAQADTPRRAAAAMMLCWNALMVLPQNLMALTASEPRLHNLLLWWEKREWQDLPNSELAGRMGMETTAFCRFFRRCMGEPPHNYGLRQRIDRACLMLRFSSLSIKEIAEKTGFCDRYHFSRTFKRLRKIGPAEFRRMPV